MNNDHLFSLSDDELAIIKTKNGNKNKLGFAILLKYFQLENHYPKHIKFIDPLMLHTIANQLNVSASLIDYFDWEGRGTERYRQEIREFLGYRAALEKDIESLKVWLIKNVFPSAIKKSQRIEYAYTYFRENKIEPFTSQKLERHIRSAYRIFEQQLFESIYDQLTDQTKKLMNDILSEELEDEDGNDSDDEKTSDNNEIKFKDLKKGIPGAKLKNVYFAIQKLRCLKELKLSDSAFSGLSTKLIKKYYARVMAERPSGLREYQPHIKYATFSLFCYFKSQLLTDDLVELFIKLLHQIRTKAESYIDDQILSEVKCVNGKFDILFKLSRSALENPTGIIQDKIYPEVGQETLTNLVKELYFKGKWYQTQVCNKMHSLYSHAHRTKLLTLLDTFIFKTNLNESQPLLNAIDLIKNHRDLSGEYYPDNTNMPIKSVVASDWHNFVIHQVDDTQKINRINYELAVFQELEKQLNCKMIWVEGAFRYRNPDDDLPKDFDQNREYYYGLLGLPLNVHEFIEPRKKVLHENLKALNNSILTNKKVKIIDKNGGHIKISPSNPQVEPPNIKKLHEAIKKEHGTINLIDILKEADLQVEFTQLMETVASKEALPKDILQFRLLLCLYAIGTNTGLKCVSSANEAVNYDDLKYVKRRYLTIENVRTVLIKIINKILEIRDPRIFGIATTSVACDSKKLNVWDQNLMVEWHARYKGRGVMVYWHVDEKALCIYSQLKTCSSSEVGSMLKGILMHCTNMEMNNIYVDTHGQSTLAFGVSELLQFDLLPRLKNIYEQKLYYPSATQKNEYKNLELILKDAVSWKLMEDNYDEAIKHIVALKIGTMDPDVFVKRFSKDNYQHPVYRTIIEIGKVAKTNFLSRYLMSEELRIEIHAAQNVVERLNSVMGFIFYGKLGEIPTNIKDHQELGIVCLHLLQACMAYINTLIFQNILSRPEWQNVFTLEDKRALNVLFHSHINPYGLFPLDLSKRLEIAESSLQADINKQSETHRNHAVSIDEEKELAELAGIN